MDRRKGKQSLVFLLSWMVLCTKIQCQKDFISIDCGYGGGTSSKDTNTSLTYMDDSQFIDSGTNYLLSLNPFEIQYGTLRSFPDNTRNCYKLSPVKKGGKYLIRAVFYYGNYDGERLPPVFDLHVGINFWCTIDLRSGRTIAEIVTVSTRDSIDVCLINTGKGTPIISELDLRPLPDFMYPLANDYQSLALYIRWNYGTADEIRYPDDPYDRLWLGVPDQLYTITTSNLVNAEAGDIFQVPAKVLGTAISSPSPSTSYFLPISPVRGSPGEMIYIGMHFAELLLLSSSTSRVMNIYGGDNETLLFGGYSPPYLRASHKEIKNAILGSSGFYNITIYSPYQIPNLGKLSYMINAIESYIFREMKDSQTDESDVSAMGLIKRELKLARNWQGDPCYPRQYSWKGVDCSYDLKPTRIISLDLSSSGLVGELPSSIGQLTALRTLNISGNAALRTIPRSICQRASSGQLSISIADWASKCESSKGNNKKSIIAVVVALCIIIIISLVATFLILKRRKNAHPTTEFSGVHELNNLSQVSQKEEDNFRNENPVFTYEQIKKVTQNFKYEIGKGGFGSVFLGDMSNGTRVAVKVLSSSSLQGSKEFEAEIQLLARVHHRNLVTLIGYCDNVKNLTLAYEYMDNGTLQDHLKVGGLNWNQRVSVALQAAQGLDYLHNGCRPPIVHRDIKSANILLSGNLVAKIADFGLSRTFKNDNVTHITTKIAGTPGYIDPWEFHNHGSNEKSDVYSFGVVLLEIITGQPPYVITTQRTHIIQWVSQHIQAGDIGNIIDPRLKGDFDTDVVWKIIKIAVSCTSNKVEARMTMSNVVVQLKQCAEMIETQEVYDDETSLYTSEVYSHSSLAPYSPAAR